MGEASTLAARPRAATAGDGAETKRQATEHLSPAAEVAIRLLPGNDVRISVLYVVGMEGKYTVPP